MLWGRVEKWIEIELITIQIRDQLFQFSRHDTEDKTWVATKKQEKFCFLYKLRVIKLSIK